MASEEDLRVAREVTPQFQYEPDVRYVKRVRRVATALSKARAECEAVGLERAAGVAKRRETHYAESIGTSAGESRETRIRKQNMATACSEVERRILRLEAASGSSEAEETK